MEILLKGRVLPIVGEPGHQAILIKDGRIVALGGQSLVAEAERAGTAIEDHADSILMPGFVDPHVHFEHLAVGTRQGVDCRYPRCRTIDDVLDVLAAAVASNDRDAWVIGYGNLFYDQKLADRRLPARSDLDRVSSARPIVLHCGGHVSVLNSAAMNALPADVFGDGAGLWGAAKVELGSDGQPTGRFAEIAGHLPAPPVTMDERRRILVQGARDIFLSQGVTTLGEMSESLDSLALFQSLSESGELPIRVRHYLLTPAAVPRREAIETAAALGRDSKSAARFGVAGVKAFVDGGYSARNAATMSPYIGQHSAPSRDCGRLNMSYGQVRALVREARSCDVQVALHANGTRAHREVLQALLDEGQCHEHDAVRVEHLGNYLPDKTSIIDWKRANVLPVVQPGFLYAFIGDFLPVVLGDEGRRGRVPLRTILDEAVYPAISSDIALGAEDELANPFFTVAAAVRRRSYWGEVVEEDEAISVDEALRLHTIEAARALHLDQHVGSLEVGKVADVVVLPRDPRTAGEDLQHVRPSHVYVGGELAHS